MADIVEVRCTAKAWNPSVGSAPVPVRMWWDEGDPLVIHLGFHESDEVIWDVSRETFVEGSKSPASVGEGDVQVRRVGQLGVLLSLRSPEGTADVLLPYGVTLGFLAQIEDAMPLGGDREAVVVDHLIEEFLTDLENEGERP